MRLNSFELGRVFLAPLSGVADSPFRRMCKRFGADVVYSEMTSSEGLSRGSLRSKAVLRFHEEERPIGIQIFGRDPSRMAASAAIVEKARPEFVDINMSCPARKVVARGAGCALLREPRRISEIAASVVAATGLPVTAKIRIGWDEHNVNAVEVAKRLEDAGVAAVCVHGRTWKQGFRDRSSWSDVAKVKQGVGIPVILSGDVTTPEEAQRAFEETGCDAVMVGRGVYGRPWIFRTIKDYLGGRSYTMPRLVDMVDAVLTHLDLGIAEFGERTATVRFRKHLLWYTKGVPGVVALRPPISKVSTKREVVDILSQLLADVKT